MKSRDASGVEVDGRKIYPITFELDGPLAMFTRADTGAVPISYPIPTPSALRGIVENIKRTKGAYFVPVKVQVCKPIRFANYSFNYGGPLRKSNLLGTTTSMQVKASVLHDVCYKVFGVIESTNGVGHGNTRHALQCMLHRRIQKGRCYQKTYFGWSEFFTRYLGPLRSTTSPIDESANVGAVLRSVFAGPGDSAYEPKFIEDVSIDKGEVIYEEGFESCF